MPKAVSIYMLLDPRAPNVVRYVGKTECTLAARLRRHELEAALGLKSHRFHWVRELASDGVSPAIELLEIVPAEVWREREKHWISHFRLAGHPLTNASSGGDGNDSATWRQIWSRVGQRANQSMKLSQYNARPDVRERKRLAMVERYKNPIEREKQSQRAKASMSPALRAKRAELTRSTWADPVIRARRLAGLRKSKKSGENKCV